MTDKEHDREQAPADMPFDEAKGPGTSDADVSQQPIEAEAGPPAAHPLPGDVLAARSNELRLSIDEVCTRVKLAPRQIIALEANDFGALPGMATVRGFIRSYAKVLGLDPAPLLAAIAGEPNPALGPIVVRRPLPSPAFSGRRYSPPVSHRRGARRLAGLAAVVLVFVGTLGFIAYRNDWLQGVPIAVSDLAVPKPAPEPVEPVPSDAAAPTVEDLSAADTTAPPSANANVLQLVLREDAWIEVATLDGARKLVSKLMRGGTTETITIVEPVSLVVGNAAGVDATLRGQPLNLRAAARDNVAKINLK